MKIVARILSLLVIASMVIVFSNCGGGGKEGPSAKDQLLEALKAGWKVAQAADVTLDGASPGVDYTDFTLSVSGTDGDATFNFSTSGRPAVSPWQSSGTFTFGTPATTQVVRNDDGGATNMTYAISGTTLTLTFTYDGAGFNAARTKSVEGVWVFVLTKV